MAVGMRDSRRIGQELTGLQCRPKRLDQLGNELVREPDRHQHPPRILGCCNHRENPGTGYRYASPRKVLTYGDMNYGADFRRVECRNQPARVFCGDGGEVYTGRRSSSRTRLRAVDGGDDD